MRKSFNNQPKFAKGVYIGTMIFFFLPLVILAFYSFNESKSFNWTGFSLKWYQKLFSNSPALWSAVVNSLLVALVSATNAKIIATLVALRIN